MTANIKRSYPRECHTSDQGRKPCTCGALHTANTDGTSPHEDVRDMLDVALDFAAVLFIVVVAISIVFGIAGFVSAL